jgi:hypothetical protein
MAGKEISLKRYVVRLNTDEREQLEALIGKGKSAAQRLLKARILLNLRHSGCGRTGSDTSSDLSSRHWPTPADRHIGISGRIRGIGAEDRVSEFHGGSVATA